MTHTETPATGQDAYLLDPSWHAERERLNSLSELYDDTTMRLIEALPLPVGAHCADVGAGTGSVALRVAELVGPQGHVVATDTDTRFLEPLANEAITVVRADVTVEPPTPGAFDLVHARLLLEHLVCRDTVLMRLTSALAPGGWLVVEDLDWATATLADPPSPVHARIAAACRSFMLSRGYEPDYGRRLPRLLRRAGLVDVRTHTASAEVRADAVLGVPQWELLVDQLAPGLLAERLVSRTDLRTFTDLCHDGDTVFFAPLMVSSWGRNRKSRT